MRFIAVLPRKQPCAFVENESLTIIAHNNCLKVTADFMRNIFLSLINTDSVLPTYYRLCKTGHQRPQMAEIDPGRSE